MPAKHPAAVAAFLADHAKDTRPFFGAIDTYDSDEHEVDFRWRMAASVLETDEPWDPERFAAIGFLNGDLPLFIDVSKKAVPVFVRADGELLRVCASFESFAKKVAAAPKGRAKGTATKRPKSVATASEPRGPKTTYPAPTTLSWPSDPVVGCVFGSAIGVHDFLWFDKVKPKEVAALVQNYVRPKNAGSVRSVAKKWDPAANMKLDRGTGVWLDFAAYDKHAAVVTPRVKTFLEAIQRELEFLPVRATVGRETADVFIVNVLKVVPCLNVQESRIDRGQNFVLQAGWPEEACLFRPSECPQAIFATQAMVERLRKEPASGINFVPLQKYAL